MKNSEVSLPHSERRFVTRDTETGELLVVDDDGLWRRPTTDSEELLACEIERLVEQYAALEAHDEKLSELNTEMATRLDELEEQLEALERALRAIAFNAESFHKGEDGKERALKVILAWATDPKLVPEGVGYPAFSPQAPSASGSDVSHAARRLARPASDAEGGTVTEPDSPRGVASASEPNFVVVDPVTRNVLGEFEVLHDAMSFVADLDG